MATEIEFRSVYDALTKVSGKETLGIPPWLFDNVLERWVPLPLDVMISFSQAAICTVLLLYFFKFLVFYQSFAFNVLTLSTHIRGKFLFQQLESL